MVSFAEKIRKFFCCVRPTTTFDEPVVSRGRAVVDNAVTTTTAEQEAVPQTDLHPVAWEDPVRSPVDLRDIDQVGAIVKRPEDLEQEQLFPVAWEGSSKERENWDNKAKSPEWDDADQAAKDQTKHLPLPWEGIQGLVPFDGKTYGPSWAENPVETKDQQDISKSSEKPSKTEDVGGLQDESDKSVKDKKQEDTRTQDESSLSTKKAQTKTDMETSDHDKKESDETDMKEEAAEDIKKTVDSETDRAEKTAKETDKVMVDHHDEENSGDQKISIKQE